MIKVLGIRPSRKNSNTEWPLDYVLQQAEKAGEVQTEYIPLAGLKIADRK